MYKQFCLNKYQEKYLMFQNEGDKESNAQRKAIRDTTIEAMREFSDIEVSEIWKCVGAAHVSRKSGIEGDAELIRKVVAAENSWKKASGHAFEEMITVLCNGVLEEYDIEFILQKDLSILLKANEIHNEVRDISWLKEQVSSSVFDLYALYHREEKNYVFGCIQSKTSIRDRVTRDREPSMQAMKAFFWSIAITLDGDFLGLPKFQAMVNGGTSDYQDNGWHGMYVLSNTNSLDRIYRLDTNLSHLVDHSVKAASMWREQRQWFSHSWRPQD